VQKKITRFEGGGAKIVLNLTTLDSGEIGI